MAEKETISRAEVFGAAVSFCSRPPAPPLPPPTYLIDCEFLT
jgi:hypothetical protein